MSLYFGPGEKSKVFRFCKPFVCFSVCGPRYAIPYKELAYAIHASFDEKAAAFAFHRRWNELDRPSSASVMVSCEPLLISNNPAVIIDQNYQFLNIHKTLTRLFKHYKEEELALVRMRQGESLDLHLKSKPKLEPLKKPADNQSPSTNCNSNINTSCCNSNTSQSSNDNGDKSKGHSARLETASTAENETHEQEDPRFKNRANLETVNATDIDTDPDGPPKQWFNSYELMNTPANMKIPGQTFAIVQSVCRIGLDEVLSEPLLIVYAIVETEKLAAEVSEALHTTALKFDYVKQWNGIDFTTMKRYQNETISQKKLRHHAYKWALTQLPYLTIKVDDLRHLVYERKNIERISVIGENDETIANKEDFRTAKALMKSAHEREQKIQSFMDDQKELSQLLQQQKELWSSVKEANLGNQGDLDEKSSSASQSLKSVHDVDPALESELKQHALERVQKLLKQVDNIDVDNIDTELNEQDDSESVAMSEFDFAQNLSTIEFYRRIAQKIHYNDYYRGELKSENDVYHFILNYSYDQIQGEDIHIVYSKDPNKIDAFLQKEFS